VKVALDAVSPPKPGEEVVDAVTVGEIVVSLSIEL